jgi:hypothetical protein
MPIIIAAVTVIGGLCLLDLLLTFGVIRRLREHTDMLTRGPARPELGLSAGELPEPFSTVTIDGELVSGAAGLRVVAFFSSGCSICPERVAPFADYLRDHGIKRDSTLAVSIGPGSSPPPYLAEIAELARICVEEDGGEIAKAFKIAGFPAFFVLDDDGAVVVSDHNPSALPEPAAA